MNRIKFYLADSTTQTTNGSSTCNSACSFSRAVSGNFIGLSLIPGLDSVGGPIFDLYSASIWESASIWDDVCGYIPTNSFTTTIGNKMIDKLGVS